MANEYMKEGIGLGTNVFRIRKFKLLYFPVIVSILSFLIIAVISYNVSSSYMKEQIIENGIDYAQLLSRRIQYEMEDSLRQRDHVDETLLNIGHLIFESGLQVTDSMLAKVADAFKIDYIFHYNSDGVVLNSADGSYIGWKAKQDDPIHRFMISGLMTYVEGERKGTESDDYYYFAYVRDEAGDFLQLGFEIESMSYLLEPQIIQSILERATSDDDYFVYSLVTNENLIAIADTDSEDIGADYSDDMSYIMGLSGKTLAEDWYYPKLDETVIEIITPLYVNSKPFGIVVVGVSRSMQKLKAFSLASIIFLTTLLIVFNYLIIQRRNVIRPITELYEDINNLDAEKLDTKLNYDEKTIFYGIYESIDEFIVRLKKSKERIRALNQEVTRIAYEDYLTKLPTRYHFKNRFHEMMQEMREASEKIAIVLLDLNNFKEYNDTRGHGFGDEILICLGERLKSVEEDGLMVSRFGGDEFLLAIPFKSQDHLSNQLIKVRAEINKPFKVADEWLPIDASYGLSIYPDDSQTLDELIMFADLAMYVAKGTKDMEIAFYDKEMRNEKLRLVEVKKYLSDALKNSGFTMLYQPIVDINTMTTHSFEALIRFKTHDIYPDEFIPIAESTGLILPIGRFVIEQAIMMVADLKSRNHPCTNVSVNFSTKQFYDDGIIEFVKSKLDEYDVSGEHLIFEITETFLQEKSSDEIHSFLRELRSLGIEIAMDDFGTGFTSVMFFNQFPFNTIKLDKSFVRRNLMQNDASFSSWISLFNSCSYKVVAEGIENGEDLSRLMENGVMLVQGYYFSKPITPDNLFDLPYKWS